MLMVQLTLIENVLQQRVDACDNAVRNSSGGPLALEDSVEGNRSSVGTPDSSLDVLELGGQLTLL